MNDGHRFLLRYGMRAGATWTALPRFLAVTLATLAVVVGVYGVVLAGATAEGRLLRAHENAPQPPSAGSPARLDWLPGPFAMVNGEPVTVNVIEPRRSDAPLPPGVRRWPAPGGAVVSPSLSRDLRDVGQPNLYGNVEGLIDINGLESPTQRVVYLRPKQGAERPAGALHPVSSFGGPSGYVTSSSRTGVLYAPDTKQLQALIALTLVTPGAVLLFVAKRIDARRGRARRFSLRAVGARRTDIAALNAAESIAPIAVGWLLASVPFFWLLTQDLRLPAVDYVLLSADARRSMLGSLVAGALALAVCLVICAVDWRIPVRRRFRGQYLAWQSAPITPAFICLLSTSLAVIVPAQLGASPVRTLTYAACLTVVLLTSPSLVAVILGGCGVIVRNLGWRVGSASTVVSGRRLSAQPRHTAMVVAMPLFAVLVVGQLQLWSGFLGDQYAKGRQVEAQIGNSVLVAGRTSASGAARLKPHLPAGTAMVWLGTTELKPSEPVMTTIGGDCAALQTLELPCSSRPRRVDTDELKPAVGALETLGVGKIVVQKQTQPREGEQLTLVTPSGRDIRPTAEAEGIKAQMGGFAFDSTAQFWLGQGKVRTHWGEWVLTLGGFTMLLTLMGAVVLLRADAFAESGPLGPLAVLTDRPGFINGVLSLATAFPLIIGSLVGVAGYFILPSAFAGRYGPMNPSLTWATIVVLIAATLSLVMALANRGVAHRAVAQWRPGRGN